MDEIKSERPGDLRWPFVFWQWLFAPSRYVDMLHSYSTTTLCCTALQ